MRSTARLFAFALLVAACSSQPAFAPRVTPQSVPAVDIFDTGSWEKSLNATDCNDLLTKMTGAEQFQVTRVLLATVRMGTLTNAPAPSSELVSKFQQDIANICGEQGGDYNLIAAAAVVYVTDKQYEPTYR